jgi:flagellar motor switch protein FliM
MTDLLSQDEVDALLSGVEEGAIDLSSTISKLAVGTAAFDLSCRSGQLNGWHKQLGLLDAKLGKHLGQSMLGLLHKTTQVSSEGMQVVRFETYLDGLETPTGLNTFQLQPAGGSLLVAMDARLVYSLVESFFGGAGRQAQVQAKSFTRTEQRVLQLGLKTILESIKSAWKQLENQQLELCESEHNPQASSAFAGSDVVMLRRYKLSFEGGGGELHLVMSSSLVETLFQAGGLPRPLAIGNSKVSLRRRAEDFKATVAGEVSGAQLSLKQLLNLSCGDIIPVDSPEIVDVKVNGIKKFRGRVGEIDGRVGLSIMNSDETSRG